MCTYKCYAIGTVCGSFIPIKSTDKSHSIHLHRDLTQLAIFQCIEEVPECTHTVHTYTIMVLGCGETCFHQLPINGGRKTLFSLPQGVTEVAKRPRGLYSHVKLLCSHFSTHNVQCIQEEDLVLQAKEAGTPGLSRRGQRISPTVHLQNEDKDTAATHPGSSRRIPTYVCM